MHASYFTRCMANNLFGGGSRLEPRSVTYEEFFLFEFDGNS